MQTDVTAAGHSISTLPYSCALFFFEGKTTTYTVQITLKSGTFIGMSGVPADSLAAIQQAVGRASRWYSFLFKLHFEVKCPTFTYGFNAKDVEYVSYKKSE